MEEGWNELIFQVPLTQAILWIYSSWLAWIRSNFMYLTDTAVCTTRSLPWSLDMCVSVHKCSSGVEWERGGGKTLVGIVITTQSCHFNVLSPCAEGLWLWWQKFISSWPQAQTWKQNVLCFLPTLLPPYNWKVMCFLATGQTGGACQEAFREFPHYVTNLWVIWKSGKWFNQLSFVDSKIFTTPRCLIFDLSQQNGLL